MKKSRLTVFVLALGLIGCVSESCSAKTIRGSGNVVEEQRQVSDFSQVHLAGLGNLKIELGEEELLRIKAEENLLPYIETEVHGDTLRIELEDGINLDPNEPINYYVTAKKLDAVSVSGSGSVEAPKLTADKFSMTLSGSADANIEGLVSDSLKIDISGTGDVVIESLSTESVKAEISGSGNVSIEGGTAGKQEIEISGTGKYEARNVESLQADVGVSGSASVFLRVSKHLKTDINGTGSVRYIGNPGIDADVTGLGSVRQIEK